MSKLLVGASCDIGFSLKPKTKAVMALLKYHGFDARLIVDPLWINTAPSKLLNFIKIAHDAQSQGYTHLMYIDASDVVVLAGPDEVMERYFGFNHPWVYAAEPHIWPQRTFEPDDYPTVSGPYRYLNGGVSMGELPHIVKWFDRWTDGGKNPPTRANMGRGDQHWQASRFLESYPNAITLDSQCKLFQCMCGSLTGKKVPRCVMTPGKVYNRITDTHPLVIHFNGGDDITNPNRRILWKHWTV